MYPLDDSTLQTCLLHLPDWEPQDGVLIRQFQFVDFIEAFGFMTRVALVAEHMQHYPDWQHHERLLTIRLTTLQQASITDQDVDLARAIDKLWATTQRH